jgi:hypothetical protein
MYAPRKPEGRFSRGRPPTSRDPAFLLYQRSRDLLDAANGLHAAARVDGAVPALAAALGCLDAAITTVAGAVAEMQAQVTPGAARRPAELAGVVPAARARRLARSLDELAYQLEVAGTASERARMHAQPVVTRLRAA